MDLKELKRPELMALCKENGIPAKGKNEDLIEELEKVMNVTVETASIEDVVEETVTNEEAQELIDSGEAIIPEEAIVETAEQKETKVNVKAYYFGKANRKYFIGEFESEDIAMKKIKSKGYKRFAIE